MVEELFAGQPSRTLLHHEQSLGECGAFKKAIAAATGATGSLYVVRRAEFLKLPGASWPLANLAKVILQLNQADVVAIWWFFLSERAIQNC